MRPVRAKALIINAFAPTGRFAFINPYTQGGALWAYWAFSPSATSCISIGQNAHVYITPNIGWAEKDSFCTLKGLLLLSKRTPFATQNEPFCNPKGLLLKSDGNLREKGKGKREKSIGFSILPKQKTTRTRGCPLVRVVLTNHIY